MHEFFNAGLKGLPTINSRYAAQLLIHIKREIPIAEVVLLDQF